MPDGWNIVTSDIVTAENVRDVNTFENPKLISESKFDVADVNKIDIPKHSVVRICFEK